MKSAQRQTARAKADAKWAHLDPRRQQQEQQEVSEAAWYQLEQEQARAHQLQQAIQHELREVRHDSRRELINQIARIEP